MITTAEFLRIVALIVAVIAGLLFIRALIGTRRARKAAYYSTRREASQIATRYLSTSLLMATIAGGMSIVSIFLPPEVTEATPQANAALTVTLLPQATVYIVPTITPLTTTAEPTPLPSTTPHVTITRLATPTRPLAANSKYLSLRTITSAIDVNGHPISSTAEFTKSVKMVYIFFDYANVPQGLLMRQTWYLNGGSIHFDSTTWAHTGSGTMYIAWSPQQGFDVGLYEVRVLLGDNRQFSANFMVH